MKDLSTHIADWLGNRRNSKYLLAVSGGVDSMALLESFSKSVPTHQLVVAYLHHGVRPKAGNRERRLISERCWEKGLCFVTEDFFPQTQSEEELRNARLSFLERTLRQTGCDAIVTAHHGQDQLETVLMRLIRGSGVRGLSAIAPERGKWVRPFLSLSKEALRDYAKHNELPFLEDETNGSDRYFRNRVRREVIVPLKQLSLQYGSEEELYRRLENTTEELRFAAQQLEQFADEKLQAMATVSPYWIRVEESLWENLEEGWKKLIGKALFAKLGIESPLQETLRRLMDEIANQRSRFDLHGRLTVTRSCGYLYFQSFPQVHRRVPSISLENGEYQSRPLGLRLSVDGDTFECRHIQKGDRFGRQKLKEVLLKRRLPQPERALFPVVAHKKSGEVVWTPLHTHPQVQLHALSFPFAVGCRTNARTA